MSMSVFISAAAQETAETLAGLINRDVAGNEGRSKSMDDALIARMRPLLFDVAPLRRHIVECLNDAPRRTALLQKTHRDEMVLAETVERARHRPDNAYTFGSKFRAAMDKPRYSDSWVTEVALTKTLNAAMVRHIRKHPMLFRAAAALQHMVDEYYTGMLATYTDLTAPNKANASVLVQAHETIQTIVGAQRRTLIEELLPFFAMAHKEQDAAPERLCQSGLQKAYTHHAFTVLRHGAFKSCPFKSAIAELLATDIAEDGAGRFTIAETPRAGALFGLLYRQLAAATPGQPRKPAPAAG